MFIWTNLNHLCSLSDSTLPCLPSDVQIDFASFSCNTNPGTCPDDRIAYMCEDDVQVCCLVTLSAAEKKILNTRGKPRREMLRQFSEVDLDGHGKCAVNVEEEDVRKYLLSNILIVSCSAHHSSELISSSLSPSLFFRYLFSIACKGRVCRLRHWRSKRHVLVRTLRRRVWRGIMDVPQALSTWLPTCRTLLMRTRL